LSFLDANSLLSISLVCRRLRDFLQSTPYNPPVFLPTLVANRYNSDFWYELYVCRWGPVKDRHDFSEIWKERYGSWRDNCHAFFRNGKNRENRSNSFPEWFDPTQSIPVTTWQHIFLFRDRVETRSLFQVFPSDNHNQNGAAMYLVFSEKYDENFTTVMRKEVVVFGAHARFLHLGVSQEMSGSQDRIFAELASPLISDHQDTTRSDEQLILSDGRNKISIKLLQEFVGWHIPEHSDDRSKRDTNETGNFKKKLLSCLSLESGGSSLFTFS